LREAIWEAVTAESHRPAFPGEVDAEPKG